MRTSKAKRLRAFIEAVADRLEDVELFPTWMQPDPAQGYRKGDRVTYLGKRWESQTDENVWEPGARGWEEIL